MTLEMFYTALQSLADIFQKEETQFDRFKAFINSLW